MRTTDRGGKLYHIEILHKFSDDLKKKDDRFYDIWIRYSSYRKGRHVYDAFRDIQRDCPSWMLRIRVYK